MPCSRPMPRIGSRWGDRRDRRRRRRGLADLVTVAGQATTDGRPLEEATLTFTGESGQITLRTDRDGGFRLPLVRPGLYAVSAPGASRFSPPSNANRWIAGVEVGRRGSDRRRIVWAMPSGGSRFPSARRTEESSSSTRNRSGIHGSGHGSGKRRANPVDPDRPPHAVAGLVAREQGALFGRQRREPTADGDPLRGRVTEI